MLSKSEPIEANTSTTIATAAAANNNNFNLSNTANKSRATQQLLNNGTPPRQEQKQEPYLKATLAGQQATGNETKHPTNDNKIWLYFERSQNDANKLKCLLCATELCNQLNTDLHQDSSTHSVLWNHLRVKHAISRDINNSSSERRRRRQAFNDTKQHNSRINKSALNTANNSHKINDTISIRTTTTTTTTTTINNNTSPSTGTAASTTNMTNIKNHQRLNSSANTKKLSSSNHDINDLRRNLDLFEYGDLSKASLKPLPSSSLSRNLFERLNQLSSPVTRKLKFWNKKSFQVNQYDPCFKVIYLGNLGVQFWSKDESCLEKPLNTLWNNYLVNMKTEIVMRLTICNSGLKAITRQHGLTQYWSNRLVYCCSHKNYPKIFSWIYRHEGKKMRQELRCHAVFCSSPERASKMVSLLNQRLTSALEEFKREKKSRGQSPSITSNCNSLSSSSSSSAALLQTTLPRTVPLRRQILAKGSANFRPPLERSKSAPKLTSINEEDCELEEDEEDNNIEEEEDEYVASRQFNGDNNDTVNDNGDHISQDELEYEQSFDDRDDDDDDDDSNSDYNDDELGKHDDGDSSTHKVESIEEFSNSSVYATGDISYDNIVAHRHQLSANHERLDNESTLTAPIILKSSSSLRRSSLRSSSLNQNESLNSDPTESMSDGGQHELDSQLASTASSTLNSTCHINNTNNNTSTPEHENGVVAESNHDHHQNTVAHYFGQIKL